MQAFDVISLNFFSKKVMSQVQLNRLLQDKERLEKELEQTEGLITVSEACNVFFFWKYTFLNLLAYESSFNKIQ